ncbi:MAG: Fic family protein [Candidatus Nanohaloarchaea archaeon]
MALKIDCGEVEHMLSLELVKGLNALVTQSPEIEDDAELEHVNGVPVGEMDAFEVAREEDYHQLRPSGEGFVENLIEYTLPHQCRESEGDPIYLTAVLMKELAESQAFGEGNKRTAYLAGVMFLIKAQARNRFSQAVYPDLTAEFRGILQEVAVKEKDEDDLYRYILNLIKEPLRDVRAR